jgi:hypothetical protein
LAAKALNRQVVQQIVQSRFLWKPGVDNLLRLR